MAVTLLSVVQAGAILFDSCATLAKAEGLIAEAAAGGARLVVFPEAFIGGYPKGADFGARVGSRTPEGRKLFRRYFEDAIDVPGPATARLGEAARTHGVWLVIGVIERDGGTLYCTVLFFSPDGALAGKHRKLMPTAMERLIWGFGDGSTLPVLETGFGRIGAVICWENYMPMMRAAMYAQRVEVYCAPTADGRPFADLVAGDRLGEVTVAGVRLVPYEGDFTYDILPASKTGDYYAAGALVGSTLSSARGDARGP